MVSLVSSALADGSISTGTDMKQATTDAYDGEAPGVVILNPGQRYYSYKHSQAMTQTTWLALPRASAAHPAPRVHDICNHIQGNTSAAEHIEFVFDKLLNNADFVAPDARIYAIGVCDGADELVEYLAKQRRSSLL